MNKLLHTTLIAGILSTGVMAGSELPQTIESGAKVYINKNISINGTIDNYGAIDTQITGGTYPTIRSMMMEATINNHVGQSLEEITDPDKTTILNANKVNNEALTKAYKITEEGGGTINENIKTSGITVNTVSNGTLDFKSLTANDLLYLGTDAEGKTIRITQDNAGLDKEGVGNKYAYFHFGDQGDLQYSYGLEFSGNTLDITGDFSNYTKGRLKTTGSESHVQFLGQGCQLNVPMTIDCATHVYGESVGYKMNKNVTVTNNGLLTMAGNVTLKSGATLTIGEALNTITGE